MSSSFGCAGEHLRQECTDTFIENAFYLYRVENNDQQHPTHNIQRRRHCRRSSLASKLCCDITADAPKCRRTRVSCNNDDDYGNCISEPDPRNHRISYIHSNRQGGVPRDEGTQHGHGHENECVFFCRWPTYMCVCE